MPQAGLPDKGFKKSLCKIGFLPGRTSQKALILRATDWIWIQLFELQYLFFVYISWMFSMRIHNLPKTAKIYFYFDIFQT